MAAKKLFVIYIYSKEIKTSPMAMKRTTKSGKNQKFSRELREANFEAI